MKAKAYSYLIILVLLLIVFWFFSRNTANEINLGHRSEKVGKGQDKYGNDGFDRKIEFLEYTAHARCRMQCRHISQEEVKDIMTHGQINYRKSDLSDRPCPTYALEGFTRQDNQHVRIVFAQCEEKTKVVTCIDLDSDFKCNCK